MKVVGFTFIRNALTFEYPILEAIRSILPLCDEIIVAVGRSDDATLALIQSLSEEVSGENKGQITILESVWDDTLREKGAVLAVETNKAFDAISMDADWCFYIQGDECLHEKYVPNVRAAMEKWQNDPETEGLLFDYQHFYGSYDFVATTRTWYRKEIRVIKNDKKIRSWGDAQGFRRLGKKLKVREIDAEIFHYGWVRPPRAQQLKQLTFNKLWHSDAEVLRRVANVSEFDYGQIEDLIKFDGTHPAVFQLRVNAMNWAFNFDPTRRKISPKERFSRFLEKWTGWRIGEYQNYRRI